MYGYPEKVKSDVIALNEIIDRQGTDLILHVISEYVGQSALKFNLTQNEIKTLTDKLVNELVESIKERT